MSNIFKQANVTPAFTLGYWGVRRPMNILPALAKICEKLLSKQETFFFWSSYFKITMWYIAQHYLSATWETGKQDVDSSQFFGALLTDLSKAFDCLPYSLLIAKLKSIHASFL